MGSGSLIGDTLGGVHDRLERWTQEHAAVNRYVYPVEEAYGLLVDAFGRLLERDTRDNVRACDDPDFDLVAATARTRQDLGLAREVARLVGSVAKRARAMGYGDLAVDEERVADIIAKVDSYLSDEPRYLDRPDVAAALAEAEAEYDRGEWAE